MSDDVRPGPDGERIYRGIAAAGGVVHARVVVLRQAAPEVTQRTIPEGEIESERIRFQEALVETRQQIQHIQHKVSEAMGAQEAGIFDAHLLTLEDPTLTQQVLRRITKDGVNAEWAFQEVINQYAAALQAVEDEYLRERAADIRDIGLRVLNNLMGLAAEQGLSRLAHPAIIVAHDLAPSTTAMLDRRTVLGFVTEAGGVTSHTAIMARKLRIPAVVGLPEATRRVRSGDYALVDGHGGALVINPTDATLFQYGQIRERRAALDQRLLDLREQPAVTLDGHRMVLAANIDEPGDVAEAWQAGAEGIGLFRTEYLFLRPGELPDETAQTAAYRAAAEAAAPHAVVIRTMDLGGDKLFPGATPEANPFLGWRAIRISLAHRDWFAAQIRSILRASAFGTVRLMYPMISSLEELIDANAILEECRRDLRKEGIPFDDAMEVGMMIEVPGAALIAHQLAPHVDFFSLGTNDLTQYTLAVDRMNERVASLHRFGHPAVLRLIALTVQAARAHGCRVSACGEAAGDPIFIPLFVGLGVDELSATASVLPEAKFLVRRLKFTEAVALAESALANGSAAEVERQSRNLAESVAPELFSDRSYSPTSKV